MKRSGVIITVAVLLLVGFAVAAAVNRANRMPNVADSTGAVTLPNGWRITPAGKHVKLPADLPMKVIPAGGSRLLVLTAGYHDHSLNIVDVHSREVVSTLDVVKAWDGMAFDPASGTVFISGGGHAKRGFAPALARLGKRAEAGIPRRPPCSSASCTMPSRPATGQW